MAPVLGLLGRHLDRPAGAPDRYHQLRLRQGRARLPAWRPAASIAGPNDDREVPDTFSAIYEYPDQVPHQLQLLLRQRSLRLRRAVHGQRRHHRSAEPPDPELLSGEVRRQGAGQGQGARKEMHIELARQRQQGRRSAHPQLPGGDSRKGEGDRPSRIGQQAAISGHMATLSFRNNKKVVWDDKTRKYHFA